MVDPSLLEQDRDLPDFDDWRRLVESTLCGRELSTLTSRTADGISIEPLAKPSRSSLPLLLRGGKPWTVFQVIDHPDPAEAADQATVDIRGGAAGLALRFAGAPTGAEGLPGTEAALDEVLQDLPLDAIVLRLEPHPASAESLKRLVRLLRRRDLPAPLARISFGLDPIGVAAHAGGIPPGPATGPALEAAREALAAGAAGPIFEADGRGYHEAGATEAQELSAAMATLVAYLRILNLEGIGPGAALPLVGVSLAADADQVLTIAKLRAMGLLLARVGELCGAAGAKVRLHAETSPRMMTAHDPQTNLIRTTVAAFAASVGGADSIAVRPFTSAAAAPDRFARRLARTTQLLLIEEAHIHRAADAGAGSGTVEALTDALCEAAWAGFQRIEREGGIVEGLRRGRLAETIGTTGRARS